MLNITSRLRRRESIGWCRMLGETGILCNHPVGGMGAAAGLVRPGECAMIKSGYVCHGAKPVSLLDRNMDE